MSNRHRDHFIEQKVAQRSGGGYFSNIVSYFWKEEEKKDSISQEERDQFNKEFQDQVDLRQRKKEADGQGTDPDAKVDYKLKFSIKSGVVKLEDPQHDSCQLKAEGFTINCDVKRSNNIHLQAVNKSLDIEVEVNGTKKCLIERLVSQLPVLELWSLDVN